MNFVFGKQRVVVIVLVSVILLSLSYHLWQLKQKKDYIERVSQRGEIVFYTLNSPTTYYETRDGQLTGLEYDLAIDFSKYIGVKPQFKIFATVSDLLTNLEKHPHAIGAAGLSPTKERGKTYQFGPSYQKINQQIVCHRREKLPRKLSQLPQLKLLITANSSYEEQLVKLKKRYPELTWTTTAKLSTPQILREVWKKREFCTIADSNIVDISRRYFPELEVSLSLSKGKRLAWLLPKKEKDLQIALKAWMKEARKSGRLSNYLYRHYGFIPKFDYHDTRVLKNRVRDRLPQYTSLFKEAGNKYGVDWMLLAAMAYQESHWNAKARSPTGVQGIMMLTRNTASSLGVTNRLDPKQSIDGGAAYYRKISNRFPKHLDAENRTWLTLAAYNVGWGHLADAQKLAEKLGKHPFSWKDLIKVLPLLEVKAHFRYLEHGYARGNEPVRYVKRVRNYRDLIEKYFHKTTPTD